MKKISILIALILILGFTSQSFAFVYKYYFSLIPTNILSKHKFTYDMAKKMLKHPNRIYPIKYEKILAYYIYQIYMGRISTKYYLRSYYWNQKAQIQNFFENEFPKNEHLSEFSYFIKLIKDNKNFHNYYVKYSPLFPLVKLKEKELLAEKRKEKLLAIAEEKALLGNNRYKAIAIMNNYCSRHDNCYIKYGSKDVNGYSTYEGSSFTLAGNPISGGNFMITQSLFSTQLQNQLVFMLERNGYSNASTMNLTTAFVSYITSPDRSVLPTIQGLTDMVSSGNLKDFNELVSLFVKHFIKINK